MDGMCILSISKMSPFGDGIFWRESSVWDVHFYIPGRLRGAEPSRPINTHQTIGRNRPDISPFSELWSAAIGVLMNVTSALRRSQGRKSSFVEKEMGIVRLWRAHHRHYITDGSMETPLFNAVKWPSKLRVMLDRKDPVHVCLVQMFG